MQSTFSAISAGQDSLQFDEEEEELDTAAQLDGMDGPERGRQQQLVL